MSAYWAPWWVQPQHTQAGRLLHCLHCAYCYLLNVLWETDPWFTARKSQVAHYLPGELEEQRSSWYAQDWKTYLLMLLADVLSLWKKLGQFELRLPYLGHMYVGPRNRTHCPNADEHATQRMCIACATQTSWKNAHKETQIFKLWLSWLCVVYEQIRCRLFLNLDFILIILRHIFKCFSASISQQTNLLCRLQAMTKALELYWFPRNKYATYIWPHLWHLSVRKHECR